jgi:putative inorganic carbon (hco3(-)) transporter
MLFAEIYQIRYLLLLEFSLLSFFAIFGLISLLALLALLFLILVLLVSIRSPIIAVHILIFSILIDALIPIKDIAKGPTVLLEEILLLLFIGLFTIKYLLNLDQSIKIPVIILLWISFLLWSLPIGLLIGIEKFRILIFWKNYFAGFFTLVLVYYSLKNSFQLKSIIIGLIIWGLILALIEFKVLFELGGFTSGIIGIYFRKNLLQITWGQSNYLASFFVIIIPITIGYLFYTKSKKTKIFISAALALMSFAMILTLSRGGILALLIALFILSFRTLKTKTLIPFLSLVLIVIIVILLNPLTYVVINSISNFETSGSVYSRINFYEDTWNAFLKFPLTGVGFGNLSFYSTFILGKGASSSAHNIILGMLGEVGIVGALLFFSILGAVISKIYKDFKSEENESLKLLRWSFFASIIGAFLHSLVEPTFEGFQFAILFWTMIGTALNLRNMLTSNEKI